MGRRSAKIASRKNAQTLARTKIFARIGKQITMAAKAGGSDLIANKALAAAVDYAKSMNFPKDTMERTIARATSGDQADFKPGVFEAYGHGGVAIFIDVLTDNANRAAADIRSAINKSNLKIASPGSVSFNFERKAVVRIPIDSIEDDDEFILTAIDAGADECDPDPLDDAMFRITSDPPALRDMAAQLSQHGYDTELAQVEMVANSTVTVSEEDMELNLAAVDRLQALDDVDGVYLNAALDTKLDPEFDIE